MKTRRVENYLKVINFDYPEWIPVVISIMPATWLKYGSELEKIVLSYNELFPDYNEGDYKKIHLSRKLKKGKWKDAWGVTWENIEEGLSSIPEDDYAPLKNWDDLQSFIFPDSMKYEMEGNIIDWEMRKKRIENIKKQGGLVRGSLYHGAMYMRLYYMRGFMNFMIDVATKDPHLDELITKVLDSNMAVINKYIEMGAEMFVFADDLGIQKSLPISPQDWRHYLKPCFAKMYGACREKGVYTYQHTDGYILDIIPDLIECGLNVLNPQFRANTLKGIEKYCKGKIAIDLDLDRQLFPFATPQELQMHITQAVETLALPEGGLMLKAEIEPDVPLKNVDAICRVFKDLKCCP